MALSINDQGQIANRVTFGDSAFNGSNIRGAYTSDGSNFYGVGASSGTGNPNGVVWYATPTTSTQIFSGNHRGVTQLGDDLFIFTGANSIPGNPRVQTISGLPSTATTPTAFGAGLPTTGAANIGFSFDLNPLITGVDTMYLSRDTTVEKFSFDPSASSWVSNGAITVTSGDITAEFDVLNNRINIFSAGTASLRWFADNVSTYHSSFTGGFTTLATAPTNTNFRGVEFAVIPEPGTLVMVGLMGVAAVVGLRRKKK